MPKPKAWRRMEQRDLSVTPVFRLTARTCQHPERPNPHDFYVLEAPDWVNVVPLTARGQVLMVRQYRHGLERITLEIPGGMVDPEDPGPLEAARRELLEETGYLAQRIDPIGDISPNPAILDNRCHSFVATDLVCKGAPEPDGNEELELLTVPLERVPELIRSGEICHSLVVVAFCHLLGLGDIQGGRSA